MEAIVRTFATKAEATAELEKIREGYPAASARPAYDNLASDDPAQVYIISSHAYHCKCGLCKVLSTWDTWLD